MTGRYHFNKEAMDAYDKTISALSGKGMTVTVIILNDWNRNTRIWFIRGQRKLQKQITICLMQLQKKGFEQTKAIASFLAEHYSGNNPNYGKVSTGSLEMRLITNSGIIWGLWIHKLCKGLSEGGCRVFYTAIKSTNANDEVYFSLDYNMDE